jgi:hypothetical protein
VACGWRGLRSGKAGKGYEDMVSSGWHGTGQGYIILQCIVDQDWVCFGYVADLETRNQRK